ncbi:hypothetical protein ES332_D05G391600v1 [Gossypium tomentosum]|uniref:Uncharacterized protein n=1 Tax=Gossypium tomentosum TaxID=34277 RepID=A0A5D2L5E7_GOSTO|nr:hypothetical protein ES332_D05G391600v1 [Gossypium tomentosum]
MDPTKKQKLDENGIISAVSKPNPITKLTPQDGRKLIKQFTIDQLLDILQDAVCCHLDVLFILFIRGLGWDTTTQLNPFQRKF